MRVILSEACRSIAWTARACSYAAGYLLLATCLTVLPFGVAAQSAPVSITADQTGNDLTEGDTATFTVSRRGDTSQELRVNYATGNGKAGVGDTGLLDYAEAGKDYTATSGTLVFPAGSSQSQMISVPTLTDSEYEPRHFFHVRVSGSYNDGGSTVSFEQAADMRINEKEVRLLTLSPVSTVTVASGSYPEFAAAEGGQNVLTITLDKTVPYDLEITYNVGENTSFGSATGDDYTIVRNGKSTIRAGCTTIL